MPALIPRVKAHLHRAAEPTARPLGVGTVEQIAADILALEQLGAAEVILDPNPDTPRNRSFGTERQQLRAPGRGA